MGLVVAPVNVPISIYRGSTFRLSLAWKTGPSAAAATPVDLTGCTARAQVQKRDVTVTVLADMTTENGGIALGGTAGTIDLYLADEITATLPWWRLATWWFLDILWPDGDATRLVGGPAKISP